MDDLRSFLPTWPKLLLLSSALYASYHVGRFLTRPYRSALRNLPGPPGGNIILGHFGETMDTEPPLAFEVFGEKYGHVFKSRMFLNSLMLNTTDFAAINHVLQNTATYPKPSLFLNQLRSITGNGVLVAEGHEHAIQRRALNPSFSPAQIRDLTDIFVEKANKLRDLWFEITQESEGATRIDVLSWLSKTTLEVIGVAGFGYQFDALNREDRPNVLNTAFNNVLRSTEKPNLLDFVDIPFLGRPTKIGRDAKEGLRVMYSIGRELIEDRKRAVLAAAGGAKANVVMEKGSIHGRDLLSVLVKANMASDIPASQRLSDDDVLAQVPTFLAAGHETSSTVTTWALYALSKTPSAQRALRAELRAFPHEEPTLEDLAGLPYLDAVVRETLRLHPPLPATVREATRDDVIPLERPFVDVKGEIQSVVRVSKGDMVLIPILVIHRLEDIWGPDAKEYKPERWFHPPEAALRIPSMWGNTLSFLAGSRGCIGYRFAVAEVKMLLFALVKHFEFELAVPASDISARLSLVQRPVVLSEREKGNQMPLLVRPYVGAE